MVCLHLKVNCETSISAACVSCLRTHSLDWPAPYQIPLYSTINSQHLVQNIEITLWNSPNPERIVIKFWFYHVQNNAPKAMLILKMHYARLRDLFLNQFILFSTNWFIIRLNCGLFDRCPLICCLFNFLCFAARRSCSYSNVFAVYQGKVL